MSARALLIAAVLTLSVGAATAQPAFEQTPYRMADAEYETFVDTAESHAFPPFNEEGFRRDHPVGDWRRVIDGKVEISSIAYRVDGLRITGAVVRPKTPGPHPILIWARGGVGRAQLDAPQMVEMGWWANRGYVVVASNFRGAGGSEGKDEFVGADVRDLVALIPIARSLPGVDPDRVFAVGFSRGGAMLYRALSEGAPFRAVATAGAVTDLNAMVEYRPDFALTFADMMPDYAEEAANRYCRRSAVCWPERIGAPVLIAHGGLDRAVPPSQATALAAKLEAANRPYRLSIFGGGDHPFAGHRLAFFEQADALFREQR